MSREIISYIGAFIVGLAYAAYFWRYLGWGKTLLIILACVAVDIDHFLFGSQGFREHPAEGVKIMHSFHAIEFAVLVVGLNLVIGIHTFKSGRKAWLFPRIEDYKVLWQYYLAWTARIIMLGVFLHYAQDLPIYAIQWKWGFYDYSMIHYLLLR